MHFWAILPFTPSIMKPSIFFLASASIVKADYWLEKIQHRGFSPYGNADYQVFRNVKNFGAKGDGSMTPNMAKKA